MFIENKKVRLSKEVSNLGNKVLKAEIKSFIFLNTKIFCKAFNRRPLFINEFLEFSEQRGGSDENYRRRAFFSAIELIKKAEKENISNTDKGPPISYELKGVTPKQNLVGAHIKEFTVGGDRILKLVSIFWKE